MTGTRKCEKFNLLETRSGNKNIIYVPHKSSRVLYQNYLLILETSGKSCFPYFIYTHKYLQGISINWRLIVITFSQNEVSRFENLKSAWTIKLFPEYWTVTTESLLDREIGICILYLDIFINRNLFLQSFQNLEEKNSYLSSI